MSNELAHHLDQARREFLSATAERARGNLAAAHTRLLKAAEHLLKAARLSRGRLRQSRLTLAQDLLNEAEALKAMPTRVPPTANSGVTNPPISIGDDQQATEWLVQERPQVTFEDVAGLDEVKEQIRLKLLYPFTHPEMANQYNIRPGGGILLYGPPGTGKTLMARAVAGEIQAAFYAIKPSEIMSQWVGVAEQNVARLFAEAGQNPLSVIFIDELEALAPRRRSNQSTVMARVVPQVLAELDGFEKHRNPILMIGATNEPWSIDSAVLRPGRLDRLIYIPPPDFLARRKILELNLRQVPVSEDVSLDDIADRTQGFSGADMASLAQRTREWVFTEAVHEGHARPLEMNDFWEVLNQMHPSIPEKELRMFEKFSNN